RVARPGRAARNRSRGRLERGDRRHYAACRRNRRAGGIARRSRTNAPPCRAAVVGTISLVVPAASPWRLEGVAGNLAELVAQIPLRRTGTPDDIAQLAVVVLSERFGRYVIGITVEVDGGLGLMSWIPAKA